MLALGGGVKLQCGWTQQETGEKGKLEDSQPAPVWAPARCSSTVGEEGKKQEWEEGGLRLRMSKAVMYAVPMNLLTIPSGKLLKSRLWLYSPVLHNAQES